MSTVLVTGGSGFVGSHCIIQLLDAGHRVQTTVRNVKREPDVRAMVSAGGAAAADRLSFFAADLASDAGWAEAVSGCDYVLHVASPFPPNVPKHEDELIVPAREGALRVLREARKSGVRRVVLTSSFAAIGYGRKAQERPFDETDWTDPNAKDISAYVKSKTLAERAAWDFVAREGGLSLAVVNPVGIFGPVLGPDYATSIGLLQRMLEGGMPAVPRMYFGVVDVRDVADLHLRAMTDPAADGQRFLALSGDFMSMQEMGRVLKARMGAAADRAPTRQMPDWLVRFFAPFVPALQPVLTELGKLRNATGQKAKRLLGWSPRSREDSLVASAESLVKFGFLKTSAK